MTSFDGRKHCMAGSKLYDRYVVQHGESDLRSMEDIHFVLTFAEENCGWFVDFKVHKEP